jgi:membrane protease YdiL (CAAX protease family)
LCFPFVCVVPYALVSVSAHIFRWQWFVLYAALPVVIAFFLQQAAATDPDLHGNWRDAIILMVLGLSEDLRWFDGGWPGGLQALNKLLLVDMGLYGFLAIRRLDGVGFDFCFRWSDWKTGLRELVFFTPFVLTLGLALGFIHPHVNRPQVGTAVLRWALIFLFTALPEELFFRGWVQNLLERRLGRRSALVVASVLFGLSHFNKRAAHFNWRYVFWPQSPAFSMGAHGTNTVAWPLQPSRTPVWIGSGVSGSKAQKYKPRPALRCRWTDG